MSETPARGVALSEDERDALARATGHLSTACEDYRCETCVATIAAVEDIIAARVAAAEVAGQMRHITAGPTADLYALLTGVWRNSKLVTSQRRTHE